MKILGAFFALFFLTACECRVQYASGTEPLEIQNSENLRCQQMMRQGLEC